MDQDYSLFAAIVSAGSLSAAGRTVRLSPAMVSKRLARLEARLGTTLISRTTRRLALTSAGERFYSDVLAILEAAKAAEARVAGDDGIPAGPLRISAPTSFGRLHVAPHLKGFLDQFPRLEIEINLSDEFIDLLDAKVDLAIRITPQVGAGVVAKRLATSRRILCAAPSYIEGCGEPETITELQEHRILAAQGQLPWLLSGKFGPETVIDRQSYVKTNSSEVVRELTVAGVGIGLRSLWDISEDLANKRLVQVLPGFEGSSSVGIYAVSPGAQKPSSGAEAFTHYLENLYMSLPPWEGA